MNTRPVNITHHFAPELDALGILDGANTIDQFLANARRIGKEQNDLQNELREADPEDPLRERNRIVGDAFEVFGEFLIKHKRDDDRVLISKYGRPPMDNGIDGEGFHPHIKGDPNSGVSVFVQFKCYQEFDPETRKEIRLVGKQLDSFQAECMHVLRERFPDGHIIPGWPRMLVVTSAKGFNSYTEQTKYRGLVKCWGIDELRQLTCSPDFWDAFRDAL